MNDTPDLYGPPDPDSPTTLRLAGDRNHKAAERLADLGVRDEVGGSHHVVAEEDSPGVRLKPDSERLTPRPSSPPRR